MIEIYKINANSYFKYIYEMNFKNLPTVSYSNFCVKFHGNLFGINFDGTPIKCYNLLKDEIEDFNLYNFKCSAPKENLPESVRKELRQTFIKFHISLSLYAENTLRNLLKYSLPEEFI